jgi:hypothetical protein
MSERALVKLILFWLQEQADVWCMKTLGGPLQRRGVPDIIGCVGGIFFGLEVKTDDGKVSVLQHLELNRIAKAKGYATVVRSVDDVKRHVADLRELAITKKNFS